MNSGTVDRDPGAGCKGNPSDSEGQRKRGPRGAVLMEPNPRESSERHAERLAKKSGSVWLGFRIDLWKLNSSLGDRPCCAFLWSLPLSSL